MLGEDGREREASFAPSSPSTLARLLILQLICIYSLDNFFFLLKSAWVRGSIGNGISYREMLMSTLQVTERTEELDLSYVLDS